MSSRPVTALVSRIRTAFFLGQVQAFFLIKHNIEICRPLTAVWRLNKPINKLGHRVPGIQCRVWGVGVGAEVHAMRKLD